MPQDHPHPDPPAEPEGRSNPGSALGPRELDAIHEKHAGDPDVVRLVDEHKRANRVLTDVTAILDTLQMSRRGHEPDERSEKETRDRLDRLLTLLHSFHTGDEATERDAAIDAMEEIHREFHQGGP